MGSFTFQQKKNVGSCGELYIKLGKRTDVGPMKSSAAFH